MDITYNPMARGFICRAAVLDWFTRRVLSGRISITLEADFCIEAVEEALARHGMTGIFNTDQFTGVRLHQGFGEPGDLHGWQTGLARQRLRRVPVANHLEHVAFNWSQTFRQQPEAAFALANAFGLPCEFD